MTSNFVEHSASGSVITDAGGAVFVEPEPAPALAKVRFFTRLGGVSSPPFDSLNISKKVGDSTEKVEENLSRIHRAMGGDSSAWVRQVAGDTVVSVSEGGFAGEADALVTAEPGLSLVVGVADCAPVALVGRERVAMVHSGWRGTLAGISGKAVRGIGDPGTETYIGPCIRRCCYEVSEELAGEFVSEFGDEVVSGRNLSLPAAIKVDLARAGIAPERIHDLGLCTGCRPDLFFSHRKQKPKTGRSLAAVSKIVESER